MGCPLWRRLSDTPAPLSHLWEPVPPGDTVFPTDRRQPDSPELPLIERLDRRLDGADGVEQISVEQSAVFAAHHSRLGADEPLLLQAADIFGNGVFVHTHHLADGLVAGIALEGLPVLCPQQIAVDSDLSRAQPQNKNFIGNREKVLERFPLRPLLKPHKIPPDIFLFFVLHKSHFERQ